MRTTPINSYFFEKNRQKLLKILPPHSLAIIPAASNIICTADQHYPFRQNSDFYYLTGINHPNAILLLSPDHDKAEYREVLFIPEITEHDKTWNGNILTSEKATLLSGIKKIMLVNEFEAIVSSFAEKIKTFYLPITDIAKTAYDIPVNQRKLAHYIQEVHPLHHFERLSPIIHSLRRIKEETEIQQIKKAIDITRKGFLSSLKVISPGKREYEIEAEITAEFIRNGANGHGFLPIIA
ncbi:MAG TPA: aminopeptidase P N-terminal domain-containing protein, partial [Bacteroidales bacterium]